MMSNSQLKKSSSSPEPRRRLSKADRQSQLLDMARQLILEEGTEALTLGRLAEKSGVTKPLVYDHFGTRAGLLAALYQEYDQRQIALMDASFLESEPTLIGKASVIAAASVGCVLAQGREIPGVVAALASTPELEQLKRECEAILMEKCRAALAPFATSGTITVASLRAMLGAAEALSYAAVSSEITEAQAQEELIALIVAMVERGSKNQRVPKSNTPT